MNRMKCVCKTSLSEQKCNTSYHVHELMKRKILTGFSQLIRTQIRRHMTSLCMSKIHRQNCPLLIKWQIMSDRHKLHRKIYVRVKSKRKKDISCHAALPLYQIIMQTFILSNVFYQMHCKPSPCKNVCPLRIVRILFIPVPWFQNHVLMFNTFNKNA